MTLKTAFLLLACSLFLFTVTACNTVEGVGKDIQHGARATKDVITN